MLHQVAAVSGRSSQFGARPSTPINPHHTGTPPRAGRDTHHTVAVPAKSVSTP